MAPTWTLRLDARSAAVQGQVPPQVDLDLDGRADLAVGSPFTGRVRVWFSRADGLATEPLVIARTGTEDRYGLRLQYLGDLDRDGSAEIAVWHRIAVDLRQSRATNEPGFQTRVNEVRGNLQNLVSFASLDFDREGTTDFAGGFGTSNTVVLRPFRSTTPANPVTTMNLTGDPASGFGSAIVAPGDLDGDGFPDLAVASPNVLGGGRVSAYLASSAGFDRVRPFPSPPRRAGFGAVLRAAGDVNGDGFADVIAPLTGSVSAVYLGASEGFRVHSITGPDDADLDLYAAGDVDGDGFFDLVAAFPGRGEAWLWRGSAEGPTAMPEVIRDLSWAQVSGLFSALGDVDGDGFDDVAVGLPATNRVRVVFGARTEALRRRVERVGPPDEEFGVAILGSY